MNQPFHNPQLAVALQTLVDRRRDLKLLIDEMVQMGRVDEDQIDVAANAIERAAEAVYIEEQRPVPLEESPGFG